MYAWSISIPPPVGVDSVDSRSARKGEVHPAPALDVSLTEGRIAADGAKIGLTGPTQHGIAGSLYAEQPSERNLATATGTA